MSLPRPLRPALRGIPALALALLGLWPALGSVAAHAETAPASTAPPSDEQPSEGEALAARQFRMLDFNGDGYLSRGEVALFPRLSKAFDAADANHDGRVSFEEIRSYARELRAQKDKAEASSKADSNSNNSPPSSGKP